MTLLVGSYFTDP